MSKTNPERIIGLVLIGSLLFYAACYSKVVRFQPPPAERPGLVLPAKVRVKLKEKTTVHPEQITGKLVSWKNGKLDISSRHKRSTEGHDRMLEIPVGNIEQMEILTYQRTKFFDGFVYGLLGVGSFFLLVTVIGLTTVESEGT